MNYTRGKLIASPAYGEKGELCYYNVKLGSQSLASFHDNSYIGIDLDEAKGNAELYAKAAEMFEALEKVYSGYGDPKIQDMVETLLKEIEK